MTLAITNTSKTIMVLNIPRDIAPVIARLPRTTMNVDGSVETKVARVVHGDSLTLLKGETKTGLPNAYRKAPDIRKGVLARTLIVVDEPAVEESTASGSAPVGVDSEGQPTTSHRPQSKGSKQSG
jgi:hypothetical protein